VDRKWDKSKPPLGPFALNKDSLQAQGLSAWWPLNDGGSTQFDLVGGAHGSGALSNRTLGADGQPAVKLNGTSEYISVGAGKFPFLKTSAFCLSARVATTSTAKGIICNWQVGTTPGWQWITNTGGVHSLGIYNADGTNGFSGEGGNVTDGLQKDLFVSYDGSVSPSGIQTYVNGYATAVSTATVGTGDPGTLVDNAFQIGARNGALFLPGTIGDIRVYSDADNAALRALSISDPSTKYELWYPLRSKKWFSAGGGGASGTSATTNANDTPSASGTTTVTGTSSKTNANDTSSASGTTTVVGTSAKTNANDASSASGTTTVIGTLAKTNADDTSAASGTVGSSGTTGTVAATNANDTAAASGTTKIVGTLSTTNANDAATASGVAGAVSGTVAVTNANDTASAVGDAGAPVASGAGMGFSMSRMRRLVKIQFNGKLYQAFEEDIPELLETLEEQAEQKIKKKRNARAKPAPVATVVSAPADVLPSLQSRIDDVNHSIGVLWGVDEDEDEELLWLML